MPKSLESMTKEVFDMQRKMHEERLMKLDFLVRKTKKRLDDVSDDEITSLEDLKKLDEINEDFNKELGEILNNQ